MDGNGFVAAFVGGLAFGAVAGPREDREVAYVEETGGLASELAWLIFGAVALPTLVDAMSWRVLLYAVLSLTVVRMLPVAVSLLGNPGSHRGGRLRRLVRSTRSGLGHLCPARPGGSARGGRRAGRDHRHHGALEHRCPWPHRAPACAQVRRTWRSLRPPSDPRRPASLHSPSSGMTPDSPVIRFRPRGARCQRVPERRTRR